MKVDKNIKDVDNTICDNIASYGNEKRGLLSQNILAQLRNLIECISFKIYCVDLNVDKEFNYEDSKKSNEHVTKVAKYNFLDKFHQFLQMSTSHYTFDAENSERLMLKYYKYLVMTKKLMKIEFGMDILSNLSDFPIDTDPQLTEYYSKISEVIEDTGYDGTINNVRYYVQKVRPFFVSDELYYEVTLTIALGNASKFDRIIAFTKYDIMPNYSIKAIIEPRFIHVIGKKMPVNIISHWEVSIRPCEIENFNRIFGNDNKISSSDTEYKLVMNLLTDSGNNLVNLIDSSDEYFDLVVKGIKKHTKKTYLLNTLIMCRKISRNNKPGKQVIRYLLYTMNNKIIKLQFGAVNNHLSDLCLEYECIPFDEMPFATSLIGHNPRQIDLLFCISPKNREHEFFAKMIRNNTEVERTLYTNIKDIENFDNVPGLIEEFNSRLYRNERHQNRKLLDYKNNIYIKGYESDTYNIINALRDLSSSGIESYKYSVENWLQTSPYQIDDVEKSQMLKQLFEHSSVAIIYGAAGTGKTTMINHISNYFDKERKLYLANTNPAVQNLKSKVSSQNCTFMTISKYLSTTKIHYDVLIIDECSTVSNSDMYQILRESNFEILVLVGDVFQIESIMFGNWFEMVRNFIPSTSIFELTKPYRAKNGDLCKLWDKVRSMNDDIDEHIVRYGYSSKLDSSIFKPLEDDEIILCLNYDGLYGINNINRFLQTVNKNKQVNWGVWTFKVGDPVIFNDSIRFYPVVHNNLKGKIIEIYRTGNLITFDVEIEKVINGLEAKLSHLSLVGISKNGKSIIRFSVTHQNDGEEDDDGFDNLVPFQIAYAVSIHKAQGLEYDSVKIIVTNDCEDMISHNIFYTAITRSRKKLKVYWSPEAQRNVISNLKRVNHARDASLLSSNHGIKKVRH